MEISAHAISLPDRPQANSIAERWVRSVRQGCLNHNATLRRVLAEYITHFNQWRPHRSIDQRPPCAAVPRELGRQSTKAGAEPVLEGLHHVYQLAA
jgi:transposase InsO family protein